MPKQNFTTRHLTLNDAQKYVETNKAISVANGTNHSYQPDFIQSQWQDPNFDITQSSYGIFTDSEQLAGYVVIWDTGETPVHPWVDWGVHPDYLDYDLSTQLFQWADKTTQRIIDRCPPNARLSLYSGTMKGYTPKEDALKRAGYIAIRSDYEMRIDMETQPIAPNPPDGFKIRMFDEEQDFHAFVHAFRNSFSDHFGHVDQPFEKDVEEFKHWFTTDKLIDPTLIFLAIDENTDEIVGYVMGMKEAHGDPTVGYIELVGVLRDYRRRGLAQTLLYHAFNEFWNRDKKSVMLGVDGDSLTNAVSLYKRVGMVIKFQYGLYEKLMRDGQELSKVSIE
jgi:mycothiol synthase